MTRLSRPARTIGVEIVVWHPASLIRIVYVSRGRPWRVRGRAKTVARTSQ